MKKDIAPPTLAELTQKAEKDGGFTVDELPTGTLFELRTKSGSLYSVMVTNPKECEVALVGGSHPQLQEPDLYELQGSTFGGSLCKLGWVGIGPCPRLTILRGGLVTIGQVRSCVFVGDTKRAADIMARAEARRPREMTDQELEGLQKEIDGLIDKKFSGEDHEKVRELVHCFGLEGQGVMLGYLDRAQDADKLQEALAVLERHYEEHWSYRPKEMRGSFITEQDVDYINWAYLEISLPMPQ